MTNVTEPTPVQLARMEGVLNLVAFQVTGLVTRVDKHEIDINELKSGHQRLESEAEARDLTVEAKARALREAKESEEAASRRTWTPFERMLTVIAVAASLFSAYLVATR